MAYQTGIALSLGRSIIWVHPIFPPKTVMHDLSEAVT